VHAIPADLSVPAEISRLTSELKKLTNRVHILIANAGSRTAGPIDSHTDEMFASVFDVNVRSVFNLVRELLPLLEAAGSQKDPSRVVTIGSIAGLQVGSMKDGAFGYDTSKAALHHLSQSFAVALGPRGVRVNCVASGGFRTAMSEPFLKGPGAEEYFSSLSPDGRLGRPEDVAGVLAFLCSRAGSHVNGAVIPLDGGGYLANAF
jgi:NAD(P)-dependent dehydrogenase (short-subunit alcohol dehydrogenase family)